MTIENCYVSAACNQTPTIADWGKNGLICYGSCNAVFIYKIAHGGGKVVDVLTGHTHRVNSVCWIKGLDFETDLVSGSTDGNVIVWYLQKGKYIPCILSGHKSNVNIVHGLYKREEQSTVVASASMDCTVKIWTRIGSGDFSLSQTMDFGYGISVAIKMTLLPSRNTVLLACAMDNSNIQLYLENAEENRFVASAVLKGHEDWVRGLDFTLDDKGDVLLASSSQDQYIRIWRISENINIENEICSSYAKLSLKNQDYIILLESVLTGHEGWVYSVSWSPTELKLLSASLDKTMIIWEFDPETQLWLENMRVGEVGGNTLGFYGGMFGPTAGSVMAYSYHGAFHIWNCHEKNQLWEPAVTVGGHFGGVMDISWEPKGEFLISVSLDKTTRIHAPWKKADSDLTTWHEIARPQVHGYDLCSLAVLSRYSFVSSAEEKIIRAFQAPENFRSNFIKICKIQEDTSESSASEVCPVGASVPSLGLSNKAVYDNDNREQATVKTKKEMYPEESYFTAVDLSEPPTEETLIQNTLWPEIQKLYGHGYEVFALAANKSGSRLASACKSTNAEHAAVLLWDTTVWKNIQKLPSHNLTIAQLAFSPDSNHILSVSRDRRWSLFSRNEETDTFELAATTNKATGIHTRIIWCCAWSHDSQYFATGSRDGKVVVWTKNAEKLQQTVLGQYEAASEPLELKGESVTALCFAPDKITGEYLVAVGLECGEIHLYKWNRKWTCVSILDKSVAHHLYVRRLAFRPIFGKAGEPTKDDNLLQLASCGSDHAVKIYDIDVSCF